MCVRRFWALGRELEAWVSGWPCCAWRGLWQVHCTPLPGGVPAAGLGLLGEPVSSVTSARLAAGPLLLVSGSCCHPRPGHRVAQEQFSPRRSQPCLSYPVTLTFYSLGSRPGKGTEGTEGLLQGRCRVRPQLLQTLLPPVPGSRTLGLSSHTCAPRL